MIIIIYRYPLTRIYEQPKQLLGKMVTEERVLKHPE